MDSYLRTKARSYTCVSVQYIYLEPADNRAACGPHATHNSPQYRRKGGGMRVECMSERRRRACELLEAADAEQQVLQ